MTQGTQVSETETEKEDNDSFLAILTSLFQYSVLGCLLDSKLLEGIALKEKKIISCELVIQHLTSKNDTVLRFLPPYISV